MNSWHTLLRVEIADEPRSYLRYILEGQTALLRSSWPKHSLKLTDTQSPQGVPVLEPSPNFSEVAPVEPAPSLRIEGKTMRRRLAHDNKN